MTTSATCRFVELIGQARIEHGSWKSETGRVDASALAPYLNGKEAVIIALLYPDHVTVIPYAAGCAMDDAFRSGVMIERLDLDDVVKRWKA